MLAATRRTHKDLIVQLTLNRPFVLEFEDRTRSSRPPREALPPAAEPTPLLAKLMNLRPFEVETALPAKDLIPLLAFWGD
jgi:hypothetical protein